MCLGQGINDSLSEVSAGGIATHVRSANLWGRIVITPVTWAHPYPPPIIVSLRKPAPGQPRLCPGDYGLRALLWSTALKGDVGGMVLVRLKGIKGL